MAVRPKGLYALAVSTALVCVGCGFGLSGPDPQRPRNEMPKCDTGKGAVVVDGVMATVASVVALALVAADEPAGALIPAGIAAAYIGGAVHGSRAVDSCRAAIDDWSGAMAARDTLSKQPPPADDEDEAPRPKKVRPPRVAPPELPPDGPPGSAQVGVPEQPYGPEVTAPVQPPVDQPPVPVQAQPQPPAQKPMPKKKAPPPPSGDDEWSDFWREVQ